MNLQTIGHLIAEQRRAKGLTLTQLAAQAAVGRSTLAALEAGKLPELGLERVARLCAAVDLVLEARPVELNQPLMAHRHLSEVAGRELTKAAIDDIITRGTISTWRKLIQAMNADKTRMPRCCRRKYPRPSSWEARPRPCTPAIAFL